MCPEQSTKIAASNKIKNFALTDDQLRYGDFPAMAESMMKEVTERAAMYPQVKYWEVINEPNFSMNPVQYVETLRVAYSHHQEGRSSGGGDGAERLRS